MKKSLVLAMTMALGVTASAYAANPFSDVPKNHWAYDTIVKLTNAGVIEGYGDTTFLGDRLITRYEMAQMIAKAMSKGAVGIDIDKLAAEFADELDTLGVRVANLEKKADAVKITGEVRFRYLDQKNDENLQYFNYKPGLNRGDNFSRAQIQNLGTNHRGDIRSRIWLNGTINDSWAYTGMLENIQNLADDKGNEDVKFQRAYFDGKLGGTKIRAGRYNMVIADGNIYDARADGVEASYGKNVKIRTFAGKASDGEDHFGEKFSYGKYYGAEVSADIHKLNTLVGYAKFNNLFDIGHQQVWNCNFDVGIWYVGATYKFDNNLRANAMYLKANPNKDFKYEIGENDFDDFDRGYILGLKYKGAKASAPGSWGLWTNYYNQGLSTYIVHTTDANTFVLPGILNYGFKGYGVGANYAVAKNVVANVAYYDTDIKHIEKISDKRLWTDVTFTF